MAIGLRCLTSKVMARVPVADWRTDWVVSTIIEAVRECYPLTADDSFVSTYDKWAALYKSMQKTNTVDQLLQASISKVFTHLSNPSKEFRGKRLFQLDLNDALGKAAAYTTKPFLPELLTATQVVINTWEKEYFKQRAPDDTKRKSTVPSADPNKRPRSEDYLVHSYVLFTPPVGRGNKL